MLALSTNHAEAGERPFVDMAGRKVMVPADVRRIVCIGGALRYVVYMQAMEMVAGVEAIEQAGRFRSAARLYSLAVSDIADTLPVIGEGGPGRLPDMERLIVVAPDLILTMGTERSQADTIELKTGIPVLMLQYGKDLGTLDLSIVRKAFLILGQALNREERAVELNGFIDGIETDLRERTKSNIEGPAVYAGAISYKGYHGITSTAPFYPPLEWIYGRNIANTLGRHGHFFIDPEQLLIWNPEIIFIDAAGLGMVAEDFSKNSGFYKSLQAVRNNRVFAVPPFNAYHSNLEIALADAYFMGKALYPDSFSDIDPAVKADEIFNFFIGLKAYSLLKQESYGFGQVLFGDKTIEIR